MQSELDHIAGALETLDLLRERLELQLNEAVDESAQDAVDETISFVASLEAEYRRRRKALHPHHETRLFRLGESGMNLLRTTVTWHCSEVLPHPRRRTAACVWRTGICALNRAYRRP